MSDHHLLKLFNLKVGDRFSHIKYSEYGSQIISVYDYEIIRAGKRDVVCHAYKQNGDLVIYPGNLEPIEYRFRRMDEEYRTDAPEIISVRQQMAEFNRRVKCLSFVRNLSREDYDAEFMIAIEAFMQRRHWKGEG